MKNFFTLLIFCCFFLNCSDDSNEAMFITPSATASLASRPEANSMFDDSHKGIYKGIVIGDISGSLYIDILNDGKIWAKLQTDHHETYVLQNVPLPENEANISVTPFFVRYRFANKDVSFEIKLDNTGNNINVSDFKFFSNSTTKVCLIKEKSTSLIKCYAGVFMGHEETGNINFTSDGQLKVKGLSKELNSANIANVNGEINAIFPSDETSRLNTDSRPVMLYQLKANLHVGKISGFLDGLQFDGNWIYEESELGSWNATRIL